MKMFRSGIGRIDKLALSPNTCLISASDRPVSK